MNLTDHITDLQLNEYLDNELKDPAPVELHLSSCAHCAARLVALQALFNEIESLPELSLSRDLALPITHQISRRISFPRFLRLTVILQAVASIIAMIFAAPFVMQVISPYVSGIQKPVLVDLVLQLQTQWTIWLNLLAQFQPPIIPEIPVIELSGLFLMLAVAGVSVFWLIGNGLLLRNQRK
jgi:anti-sigma factor RsiW